EGAGRRRAPGAGRANQRAGGCGGADDTRIGARATPGVAVDKTVRRPGRRGGFRHRGGGHRGRRGPPTLLESAVPGHEEPGVDDGATRDDAIAATGGETMVESLRA